MALDYPRSFGPGVAEVLGDDECAEVDNDRGVALLRPTMPRRSIAVLHQRPPDTAQVLHEADRLLWLGGVAPAPEILASGRATEGDESVVIRLGTDATSAAEGHPMGPEALVEALASALVALHSRPTAHCPFAADNVALRRIIDDRVGRGLVDVAVDGPYAGRSPESLVAILDGLMADLGDPDDPVFVHGALAPERIWLDPSGDVTFLGWQWSGVGDRHVDLAAAATLLTRLHGPALVGPFVDSYGFDRIDLRRLDANQLVAHLLS